VVVTTALIVQRPVQQLQVWLGIRPAQIGGELVLVGDVLQGCSSIPTGCEAETGYL
jgi:hypothetical protein